MQKPSELKPWMSVWGEDIPDVNECAARVYDYVYERSQHRMDKVAIRYLDKTITYREFFENIQITARAYKAAGVKKGDFVTMCTVMTPETIYSFYALDLLGATLNMTDPRTSPHGLREYIEEVGSKVVCVISPVYDKVKEAVKGTDVEKVIVISPADSLPKTKQVLFNLFKGPKLDLDSNAVKWADFFKGGKVAPTFEPEPYDPEHAILIMHTGGTTGNPKCVMLGDLAMNALGIQVGFKRSHEGEKFLNIMPPFIAYGYGYGTHAPLIYGVEVIIVPQFDPNEFGKLINKYHPEHTAGVPLHYQILAKDPCMANADLAYMTTTGAGGDAITLQAEDEVNEFLRAHNSRFDICKGYGMTEVSAMATASFENVNKRGSVGIPFVLTTVGVFEPETDKELDFNQEGEVCVCTPTMMLGYYNMEEETKNVIRKHSDGKYWVHTGDIGRMDEDGFVYIVNRIKRVIIRHDGFKVYPVSIENVVAKVPGVKTCCAVAIKDHDHVQGNLPFLFVEAKRGVDKEELEKTIREVCDDELAEYVIPVGYKFVSKIPYTGIGKIDYLELTKKAEKLDY